MIVGYLYFMFDSISEKFTKVLRNLRGIGKISEKNIADALEDVRMALLDADVNIRVVRQFVENVKQKAVGIDVINKVSPDQQFVKIMHDEIVELLGEDKSYSLTAKNPLSIMMVGLHGSGKTTTSAKLAYMLKLNGHSPLLVACDVYRPAAIDQLEKLALDNEMAVFADRTTKKVANMAKAAIKFAKENNHDAIIFDTAGRLHIDKDLISEVKELSAIANPDETFLVADSALGQEAVNVAEHFNAALGLTGVVLTKFDGDARGGSAISMKFVTGVPIRFIGVGEKIRDLDIFHADRMASRILGMGDVVSLVEKAHQAVDTEEQKRMAEKVKKASFDLNDFLIAMQQMQKMGPMSSLLKMIPGASGIDFGEKEQNSVNKLQAIIQSMTLKERRNPDILNAMRRSRVASGSGTDIKSVNNLLKQFKQMQNAMKIMKGPGGMKKMQAMMSQFGKMGM